MKGYASQISKREVSQHGRQRLVHTDGKNFTIKIILKITIMNTSKNTTPTKAIDQIAIEKITPPESLSEQGQIIYMDTLRVILQDRPVQHSDLSLISLYAEYYDQFAKITARLKDEGLTMKAARGHTILNPLLRQQKQVAQMVVNISKTLCLTPLARQKILKQENEESLEIDQSDEFGDL
jgi:P27 family predicted phage terminase small subunit